MKKVLIILFLGKNASYLNELSQIDPNLFGASFTTVDGQTFAIGDCDELFSIQACCFPILYSFSLEDFGYNL
jgi:glutaminase